MSLLNTMSGLKKLPGGYIAIPITENQKSSVLKKGHRQLDSKNSQSHSFGLGFQRGNLCRDTRVFCVVAHQWPKKIQSRQHYRPIIGVLAKEV